MPTRRRAAPRGTPALLTAVLMLPLLLAAEAPPVEFAAPLAHGAVQPGDQVAYRLTGGCADAEVRPVLHAGGDSATGTSATGCDGVVDLAGLETGVQGAPGAPARLELVATSDGETLATVPLALKRRQAEDEAPAHTPRTDEGNAVVLSDGDAVALGTADLTGMSSVLLRYATADAASAVCPLPSYRCYAAVVEVRAGGLTGELLSVLELEPTGGADQYQLVSQRLLSTPEGPVDLVAVVRGPHQHVCEAAGTDGDVVVGRCGEDAWLVRLDHVDLNGRGVAERHRFPSDDGAWTPLFDGSLDGWEQAGTGTFRVTEDGHLEASGGYGLLWYAAEQFDDFVLRFEYRVNDYRANSGIFVRCPQIGDDPNACVDPGYELQIDDRGETYPGSSGVSLTGAVYSFAMPAQVATNAVGEWNTYEIRAEGQRYTASLNGRTVTEFTGDRRLAGHIGLQSHDPHSVVTFRDIRIRPAS